MKEEKKLTTNKKLIKKIDTVGSEQILTKKEMVFAVLDYFNNQFKVHLGEKFVVPYMDTIKEDDKIIFDQVLMTNNVIGTPYIPSFAVIAKCLKKEVKDKKLIIFKYKSKKNYRVKTGHRQKGTFLEIIKFDDNYKTPKK